MRTIFIQASLFLLLGSTAIAAIGAAKSPSNLLITRPNQEVPKRLKITLSITNPEDLKVREGDRIAKGQVLSDRDLERRRLNRQRISILQAIAKIEQTPLPALKPSLPLIGLPPVTFAEQEAQVNMAEMKFAQAQRNLTTTLSLDPFITAKAQVDQSKAKAEQATRDLENQQRKLDAVANLKNLPPEILQHETEKLKAKQSELNKAQAEFDFRAAEYRQIEQARRQSLADLQNQVEMARSELELAQAQLRAAREQRQRDEYEYRITVARRGEEENQAQIAASSQKLEREFKLAQLQEQLSATEEKLNAIAIVKSPYAGIIKRIKTEKQADNTITVNLSLIPDAMVSSEPD